MKPPALAMAIAMAMAGCRGEPEPAQKEPPSPATAATRAGKVEIVEAPETSDVAAAVQKELARAKADGKELVVYVGAPWCEPCTRFHDAAKAGELDAVFPTLRLHEFNLDRDKDALEKAGYQSRMIPLFAVPRADGTGSGEQIEGSVKGPRAIGNITPRLQALLAKARAGR
jgi:hypothetical protein